VRQARKLEQAMAKRAVMEPVCVKKNARNARKKRRVCVRVQVCVRERVCVRVRVCVYQVCVRETDGLRVWAGGPGWSVEMQIVVAIALAACACPSSAVPTPCAGQT
jgi:hypothetical protein